MRSLRIPSVTSRISAIRIANSWPRAPSVMYRALQGESEKSVFPNPQKPFPRLQNIARDVHISQCKMIAQSLSLTRPFLTTNSSPVLARGRWQNTDNSLGKNYNFWNTLYLQFLILKIKSQKNNSQSKADKERTTYWSSCIRIMIYNVLY